MEIYNGWTNQLTWLVSLWWTNYEESEDFIKELVNSSETVDDLEDKIYSVFLDFLAITKNKRRENLTMDDINANMLLDILHVAISYIDYNQLAFHWFEDYKD